MLVDTKDIDYPPPEKLHPAFNAAVDHLVTDITEAAVRERAVQRLQATPNEEAAVNVMNYRLNQYLGFLEDEGLDEDEAMYWYGYLCQKVADRMNELTNAENNTH